MIDARSASSKGTFPFLVVATALGLFVSQRREVSKIPVQDFHSGNKLTYSSPLGLTYSLLDVVPLSFGSVGGKHGELM
jgi:hypothetical protein